VAKTCRDGDKILALPQKEYEAIREIASLCDGHRLLRATEVFAAVENELKYSASPRVLFETAVLKASMPQTDYDMEALLARIAALEKRLEDGDFTVKEGGRVASNANVERPAPIQKEEKAPVKEEIEEDVYDGYVPEDADVPPPDEMGGYVYFDAPEAPAPVKTSEPVAPAPAPTPVKAAKTVPIGDAKSTFGLFLRSMRKIARSGVLLTLCMDLDSAYEEDTFVLYTQSETIFRSLKKEEHFALIAQACEEIGLGNAFDVRLKGKKTDEFQKKVDAVRETFGGVKIDVK
jgi:hypothetical protein